LQDCEFTVQQEKLFMLQTRNGKRTGAAALKIAVDMAKEVRRV
jgi:pyruvate, orthophosphate dikinase